MHLVAGFDNWVSNRAPMSANPTPNKHGPDEDRRGRLAAKAYELLRAEFLEALAHNGPVDISTPASDKESRPLHEVILEMLLEEDDMHTLQQLVRVVVAGAAGGDITSEAIVLSLAHRFADAQADALLDRGVFDHE